MKKKLLLVGLAYAFGGSIAAQEQSHKEIVQPVLDETDDEMTEEQVAMLEALVPEEISPVRQWCTAQISSFVVLCMRCSAYMNTSFWKPKKRKRRGKRFRAVK